MNSLMENVTVTARDGKQSTLEVGNITPSRSSMFFAYYCGTLEAPGGLNFLAHPSIWGGLSEIGC